MGEMMHTLHADSVRLEERRAQSPLDKPASRPQQIEAECHAGRVRYRCDHPDADTGMVFGHQIAMQNNAIRTLCAEIDALKAELQTAVNECCNDYWIKGHAQRVEKLYGIDMNGVTTPDCMDTIRLAHEALTGKTEPAPAIAQCKRAYGQITGVAL